MDDTIHIRYGLTEQEDELAALVDRYGLSDRVRLEHDPEYDDIAVLRGREEPPTELPALEDYFERMHRDLERAAREPFRWPPCEPRY